MESHNSDSPPTLQQVLVRLTRAVDRLDNAVAGVKKEAAPDPEVVSQLATMKSENAALRDAANMAAQRLDDTIGRLKGVLGG